MINPTFVSHTDAIRMLNSYGILERMIKLNKIRPHRLTRENWYERQPVVEMKRIVDSTMTMEEIKDFLNCSYIFVKNRIKAGHIKEIKNEAFGKYRRYSKQDVYDYIEYEKNRVNG